MKKLENFQLNVLKYIILGPFISAAYDSFPHQPWCFKVCPVYGTLIFSSGMTQLFAHENLNEFENFNTD
jgi:hypothetical protein